jgi:pimeloyl-ACP methyl ester carboxylesterase
MSPSQAGPDHPPLPPALDAPLGELQTAQAGRIAYYADAAGEGRPLLLVHSINAAPSSFELKPIFEHYRAERPVYSLDLPGFGLSERGPRAYTAQLYADAIVAMLEQVIDTPADVLALSLGAEFAARAALMAPSRIASLVFVSPTGFSRRSPPGPGFGRIASGLLNAPLWSQGLFDLVTSRASIRYYLNKSFSNGAPQEVIDYAYATAHQPGARHAPLTFLSMQLFTQEAMSQLYGRLGDSPVLAIADRDPYVGFEHLRAFAAARPNWRFETLAPHMGMPHWEHPEATLALLEDFWRGG